MIFACLGTLTVEVIAKNSPAPLKTQVLNNYLLSELMNKSQLFLLLLMLHGTFPSEFHLL